MRKRYPSDLTDARWNKVAAIFAPKRKQGSNRKHSPREILNAILYVMKEGCSWRSLPKDFPHWNTVFIQRRRRTEDGTLQRALSALARAPHLVSL